MFIFGFFVGLLNAILVFVVLAFFRSAIEHRVKIFEKQMEYHGPRPKGNIFLPLDENEAVRQEVIEKNRKAGKDTSFDELR